LVQKARIKEHNKERPVAKKAKALAFKLSKSSTIVRWSRSTPCRSWPVGLRLARVPAQVIKALRALFKLVALISQDGAIVLNVEG
jgi:hypothetical protein